MLPARYDLPAIEQQEGLELMIKQILERVQRAHKLLCTQAELRFMPPINEQSIISSIALFNIVKVPTIVYQAMWDAGPRSSDKWEIEEAQYRGRRILKGWVEDTFKGYDIKSFADFSNNEAYTIHENFGWGLYVELIEVPGRDAGNVFIGSRESTLDQTVRTIHWKQQKQIGFHD